MNIVARDYQIEAARAPMRYIEGGGQGNPLIVAPTGSGKSVIIGTLVRQLVEEYGVRVLVATHRKELIEQDARAIRSVWPTAPIGIYSAGLGKREIDQITVAGVQSIWRKTDELGPVQVVIIDEAHLVGTDETTTYGKLLASLREAEPDLRVIGLTATPYRLGQGLLTHGKGAIFSTVCYTISVRRLLDDGHLSPLVPATAGAEIDLSGVSIRGGEYALGDLELAADVDSITEAVAEDVAAQLNSGRRAALVYGVSVSHASRLRNALRMAGVAAEVVTGQTDSGTRERLLEDFKAGRIRALCSCDVLTTGFDAPIVDVIALVRATLSVNLYVQIGGRGMRLYPGKENCVFLDYGANIYRHGPIDNVKAPTNVSERNGEGTAPTKTCPQCLAEVATASRDCMECGFTFPAPVRKATVKASPLHPLANGDPKIKRVVSKVGIVEVYKHIKRGADEDTPPTMRIDYYSPTTSDGFLPEKIVSEWVCIEHPADSFASRKAGAWWAEVIGGSCPTTVDEALQRWDAARAVITEIATTYDGQWLRVCDRKVKRREPGEDDGDLYEPQMTSELAAANGDMGFMDDDLPF